MWWGFNTLACWRLKLCFVFFLSSFFLSFKLRLFDAEICFNISLGLSNLLYDSFYYSDNYFLTYTTYSIWSGLQVLMSIHRLIKQSKALHFQITCIWAEFLIKRVERVWHLTLTQQTGSFVSASKVDILTVMSGEFPVVFVATKPGILRRNMSFSLTLNKGVFCA